MRFIILLVLLLAVAAPGSYGQAHKTFELPKLPQAQAKLAYMLGNWSFEGRIIPTQGEPFAFNGTAEITPMLAGRFLKQEFRTISQLPIAGVVILGYDTAAKQYTSHNFSTVTSQVLSYTGKIDSDENVLTLVGKIKAADGSQTTYLGLCKRIDADTWTYTAVKEMPDGSQKPEIEMTYRRR